MFHGDPTSMRSARAVDALVAAGYPNQAVRAISARYGHWGEFAAESAERRMMASRTVIRTALPAQCPALRGPSFGRLHTAFDPAWPRQLELTNDPPVLIEIAGEIPTDAVAVVGSVHPSMRAITAAREVAEGARREHQAVVAVDAGVGHHGLVAARGAGGLSFVIMHGDGPGHSGRGAHGGARTRFEQHGDGGRIHPGMHVRGSEHATAGLVAALEIAVAIAHTVYVIEPGIGRVHGGGVVSAARRMGKRIVIIGGDEHRAERCSAGAHQVR